MMIAIAPITGAARTSGAEISEEVREENDGIPRGLRLLGGGIRSALRWSCLLGGRWFLSHWRLLFVSWLADVC